MSQEETKKGLSEIIEKRKLNNSKREKLTKQLCLIEMKLKVICEIKEELKTAIFFELKDKFREINLELAQLNDQSHDLSLLETHIAAEFDLADY